MNGEGRRVAIQPKLDVNGRLDQLEDRLSGTQEAGGSNPPASTSIDADEASVSRIDDEGGGAASGYGESLLGHDGNDSGTHSGNLLGILIESTQYLRSNEPDFLRNRR